MIASDPMRVRRLVVLRHAKSSWDDPALADHDRPLARRGRRAAADLRRHLARSDITPELVLTSTARRAVETWEGIAGAWPAETVTVEQEPALYGASADELVARLRRVPDEVGSVMVIGHNPGMEELVFELAGPAAARDRRLSARFPTGALATFDVEGPWSALAPATTRLSGFVVPRGLRAV